MALNFCLPKFEADTFREQLRSGKIDPGELASMSTAERNAFFQQIMKADQAKAVNTLFESKLLLKNQQQGFITWAKTVAGLKEKARTELIDRVQRMDQALLTPESELAFLSDLAEQKLGVGVTIDEAATIAKLADEVAQAKARRESGGDRLEYGRARVAFDNYVNDLKNEANSGFKGIGDAVVSAAGVAKSLKASIDLSATFRQGWKTMLTSPTIWAKNSLKSFESAIKTFGKEAVMDEVNADILSRPNYDLYRKAKLAIGVTEEAFPTSLPGRIPVAGRIFKASDNAYTTFQHLNRVDLFDKYIEIAEKSGVDISDKAQLESIGSMVNSLTGRGSLDFGALGNAESAGKALNNLFFAPRNLRAHVDTLLQPITGAGGSNFVRKQAAINLVKIIAGTSAILGIADAVSEGSVEWDPRSSDFGKIKVGDTRFDVAGGMASIPVLAARLLTKSTKSTSSGEVYPINSDEFGSKQGQDVVFDFFENKLSPAAGVAEDLLVSGKNFEGEKPTVGNTVENLVVPLPITNYQELRDNPNSANMLAAMIADALGIGTNTYNAKQ